MQTTSNATLFQTSYSEALGAYRARKAVHTSGLVSPNDASSTLTANQRYGYPIHLNPNFGTAVVENPDDLAVEGSGADGGRYRVLDMKVDEERWIWTSEAGGVVRQVDVESGVVRAVYRGAKAPVPGFDFITTEGGGKLLVTGSWDRAIRVYRVVDRNDDDDKVVYPTPVLTVPNAMDDFIKCVHVFLSDGKPYIATAGSDKSIIVWDASPLLNSSTPTTLRSLHQSKPHLRPINTLSSLTTLRGTTHLYSADSMGRILEHTLNPKSLRLEVLREIQGFSTAVYDLKLGFARVDESDSANWKEDEFVSEVKEDDEGERFRLVGEIWACSGDKSAAGYRLSPSLQPSSGKSSSKTIPLGTQPPLSTPYIHLPHTDFVKSILPLPLFPTTNLSSIITGGSDEHLHIYPTPSSPPILIEAHWHELTSLALYIRPPSPNSPILPPSSTPEVWIISASLDASIRRFNLATLPSFPPPQLVKPSPDDSEKPHQQQWNQYSIPPTAHSKLPTDDATQMTAEEEAELAELMDSDDN
ncbi:hypothetical protein PHSY_003931 [Pseudozyma hubeiensis SY62]|uniref:WD40 repeat-like protein n=1 Tax=Pseudozyma hubeiensis (strain SY62) TaxID=1305764 RepID=R9P4U1_PSEHS|nr:hypothetical protein PHSY_003931 [Pseudozyma hubeiensis SY62]GAC96351.1 hypothetical protein PHSY_003931 [Pseudozyma hubeiensis SY62]